MKKAVIVVGKHRVGKSKTIREYLKPKLGIGKDARIFSRNGQRGHILSQTLEEPKRKRSGQEVVTKYSNYDLLVFSARPVTDGRSQLTELSKALKDNGYRVNIVDVAGKDQPTRYFDAKANEIICHLDR
jgi:hypothetical protein